jgi:glycosyltransferase involved in cell wall biosynthesis
LNIVYVYNKKWPSKIPGANFCTFTCYGISKVDKNNKVNLIMAKNDESKFNKDYNRILKDYFYINDLQSNFKVTPIDYNQSIGKHTMFYFKATKKIIDLDNKEKIDIIITRNTNFLPYLYFLKKKLKTKVFFEAQHFYLAKDLREKSNRKKEYFLQKIFLPKMNGLICLQKVEKDLIMNYLPNQNFCIARTGITKVYSYHKPINNKYVAYVGSLDPDKGVTDLLYAFKYINDKNLKLLIVGGKTKEKIDKLKALAKELGISNQMTVTGWVNRVELDKYLQKIKIGIVPAKDTFYNRYITSPMKIFDYFSYGIPVIGSNLPTIVEIVTGSGGFFYEKNNYKMLAQAIQKLDFDKELYEKYSKFVFSRAENLLWKERGKKLLDFFRK